MKLKYFKLQTGLQSLKDEHFIAPHKVAHLEKRGGFWTSVVINESVRH